MDILTVGGEKLAHFDLKQMICHLPGIATGMLKGELKPKQTNFIYLLYDPTDLPRSGKAKDEIERIYTKTCSECNAIDFAALLRVIFAFLKKEKYPNSLSASEIEHDRPKIHLYACIAGLLSKPDIITAYRIRKLYGLIIKT